MSAPPNNWNEAYSEDANQSAGHHPYMNHNLHPQMIPLGYPPGAFPQNQLYPGMQNPRYMTPQQLQMFNMLPQQMAQVNLNQHGPYMQNMGFNPFAASYVPSAFQIPAAAGPFQMQPGQPGIPQFQAPPGQGLIPIQVPNQAQNSNQIQNQNQQQQYPRQGAPQSAPPRINNRTTAPPQPTQQPGPPTTGTGVNKPLPTGSSPVPLMSTSSNMNQNQTQKQAQQTQQSTPATTQLQQQRSGQQPLPSANVNNLPKTSTTMNQVPPAQGASSDPNKQPLPVQAQAQAISSLVNSQPPSRSSGDRSILANNSAASAPAPASAQNVNLAPKPAPATSTITTPIPVLTESTKMDTGEDEEEDDEEDWEANADTKNGSPATSGATNTTSAKGESNATPATNASNNVNVAAPKEVYKRPVQAAVAAAPIAPPVLTTIVASNISTAAVGSLRKDAMNVVFVGHVDAGKSTICGQILYLTGQLDQRTLEKYKRDAAEIGRESWFLSWAMDTNQEERAKGKTVEFGIASFEVPLPDKDKDKEKEKEGAYSPLMRHLTILDAPGHKGFVPNMIAAAAQADVAILVISARRGEFETGFEKGGQTREHAMLVKTVGVRSLVVLINKMDDPTVEWSEERYRECKNKLEPYLRKLGFNLEKDVHFMPCSGLSGAFFKEAPSEATCPFYRGPTFFEYLAALAPIPRNVAGSVRMPIACEIQDMGTIVAGKLERGTILKNQSLTLMPNRLQVQVVQLWADDIETDWVCCGENVKLKLKGEVTDASKGMVLCAGLSSAQQALLASVVQAQTQAQGEQSSGAGAGAGASAGAAGGGPAARVPDLVPVGWHPALGDLLSRNATRIDAQIVLMETKSVIAPGFECMLHVHEAIEQVQLANIICLVDKKTGEKLPRTKYLKSEQAAIVRLTLSEPGRVLCIETFKDLPALGRFTLRDESRTIAFGKILKIVD